MNRILPLLLLTLWGLGRSLAFGQTGPQHSQGHLSGILTDQSSQAPLAGGSVSIPRQGLGTSTDSLGRFALTLPYGTYTVVFSYVGYDSTTRRVTLSARQSEQRLTVRLNPAVISLSEVTVERELTDAPPTVEVIAPSDMIRIPAVYRDVLRSIQILPGASANNELSSAYNVRGGNYDENLIYLNGYEIYRPFLLRQGVEESQSLVNPDLVDRLEFYGGAFPATYGDKLSSVLDVGYARTHDAVTGGSVHADLLSQGAAAFVHKSGWDGSAGVRYSNPALFLNQLQTTGAYRPRFVDGQLFLNRDLTPKSRVELFLLAAQNRFDLTPRDWEGNFTGINYTDVKAVNFRYTGQRVYLWQTRLGGLRYAANLSSAARLSVSLSAMQSDEYEDTDLAADIYYNDNAWQSGGEQFLKSRLEQNHNRLGLTTLELRPVLTWKHRAHALTLGLERRAITLESRTNERLSEQGDSTLLVSPILTRDARRREYATTAVVAQDIITLAPWLRLDAGVRVLDHGYTRETLVSPRGGIYFQPAVHTTLSLAAGVYYQPPFFHELRAATDLKSQRATHVVAGFEREFSRGLTLRAETFYKKLDRLIPYSLNGLRLTYGDHNDLNGYAWGADILLRGEVSSHVNSWISYGYLNTRERAPGQAFQRRLLDQTHTLRLFLQDQMPGHPNIQVHNRMLLGSGYLYHPQTFADSTAALATDFERSEVYPFYFRADLGFSARLALKPGTDLTVVVEVLNAFNRANVASYSFYPLSPTDTAPVKVPDVLSNRFFNLGFELKW